MKIQYICPHWGQEHLTAKIFIEQVIQSGFDGIEINLHDNSFAKDFITKLDEVRKANTDFVFIPQHILSPEKEKKKYIIRIKEKLTELAAYQPDFINTHTGKDYFSFEDNCRIIEVYEDFSAKTNIKVYHETHRGRFSFHAKTLLAYLEKFPEMELVGDFSHFCTVSESMLDDQQEIIEKIIPHISHIHARVGFEQAPQVNDPFAPEWQSHLAIFIHWWQKIIDNKKAKGIAKISITPEAGPAPYMPLLPFTKQAIGNQWAINLEMKNLLKTKFSLI